MKFLIVLGLYAVSFLVCRLFIKAKWRSYNDDLFGIGIRSLRSYNRLVGIWPVDDGFNSLVASAIRHTFVPAVFSALIFFVNTAFLNKTVLSLTLLYVWFPISRYKMRSSDYNEAGVASQQILKPVKSACFSIIILSIVNYVILLVSYGLRP